MKFEYLCYLWAAALIGAPALIVIGLYTVYWLWLKWLEHKANKAFAKSTRPLAY